MPRKLLSLFYKQPQCSLSELDSLFENAICGLPIEMQIDYCKRLINAAQFDLRQNVCPEKEKALKQLINAAKKEIKKLNY